VGVDGRERRGSGLKGDEEKPFYDCTSSFWRLYQTKLERKPCRSTTNLQSQDRSLRVFWGGCVRIPFRLVS